MKRVYSSVIEDHLSRYRQMVFLAGPRQVGKTTITKQIESYRPNYFYLNWDDTSHRKLIMKGTGAIATHIQLNTIANIKPLVVFDEIHKYKKWKQFLKGFFDLYENKCQIVVTGSSKLDIYRRGGDSLMGRYFIYHIFPLSVRELISTSLRETEIVNPQKIDIKDMEKLLHFGGFPEPFLNADKRFSNNWQRLRTQQLLKEDIREASQIHDLAELEVLMDLLVDEAGQLLNVASIANQINVAETTIHRWIKTLKSFYYCYSIQPWYKNVRRSLRKTPKIYLWDWSKIMDEGRRFENFMASHLYKAVRFWTDTGLGEFDLFYLRDKEKREVDFLVTKNKKPWFLVEAKNSNNHGISSSLHYYWEQLKVPHAFQVIYNMEYIDKNCFDYGEPVIVSAVTFLSQLV
ncbi:MAG: ATP-binding protein [Gammaproteobacteria bacterium]